MNKINTRNENGVKSSCNMYRTINGIEFEHWTSDPMLTVKEWAKEHPKYKFIKRGCEIFRSVNKIK